MDVNKLKSRLNIRFQPIQQQRKSLKKITHVESIQKLQQQNAQKKLRSNSQIRLPSLSNRTKHRNQTLEDSRSFVNVNEFRERAKSFKEIPKIKIQSKDNINNTITYLMKNQILNVPQIVALLQKNQSDQFIYLRMKGIYEFQACDQRQKGSSYVTLSKNGMVHNGQLITLQTLARQFDIFKKLKKIDYFNTFHYVKYLNKWKQANKKFRFQRNRENISKELYLKDKHIMQWRIQIFSMFNIPSQGGWLQDSWIHRLSDSLKETKQNCQKRLVQILFQMMQNFDLPISQSVDLLNRVLGNLHALNITFEKKIRIQKQCQKFYKLGRQLQLCSMQRTATFILTHFSTIISKITSANQNYKTLILQRLQGLDVNQEQYAQKRQKILSDSLVSMDIDYTIYINKYQRKLDIQPSPKDIYSSCVAQVRQFIKIMDKIGFKIIRTDDFKFLIKNVFKSGEQQNDDIQQRQIFKYFVTSMPSYDNLSKILQQTLIQCQKTFQRRITLFQPFLQLYLSHYQKNHQQLQFNYQQICIKYENIQQNLKFCQKLDQGQYFIIGFLKTNQFKRQLISIIKKQQQQLFKKIPLELSSKKQKLSQSLQQHLQILNIQTNNAINFIKISDQVQIIQDKILQYTAIIDQLQRIQQFYQKNIKIKLSSVQLQNIKKLLNEIRIKIKNFIQTRQNNYNKFRKSLQNQKNNLTKKINNYSIKQDIFYTNVQNAKIIYPKLIQITTNLKNIQQQLIQLNKMQIYYNLKPTSFTTLDILIKQYQNLQQIWYYKYYVQQHYHILSNKFIKDIEQEKYIKFYQMFRKKSERYIKDNDLLIITQSCNQKIDQLLRNISTIQLINSTHLRNPDLQQLNYLIQRKLGSHTIGTIKCRMLHYSDFQQYHISQLSISINQIVYKSKKQIQILAHIKQYNQWWKNIKLQYQVMQQYPMIYIFGENNKIRDQIDQYMTIIINILNNKYGNFIRNQCNQILKKINNLVELLQLAQIHQQKFLHLFPILTSKYAEIQLSTQCKKFNTILTKTMKNTRLLIKPTQNLNDNTKNILNGHIKHFQSISHVLAKFLQSKRLKFQRFYFLQDYQLLEVLVGIADQKNVFRMFQGIKGWLTNSDGNKVGVIGLGDQHLLLKGWSYKTNQPQLIFKSLQDAIKTNLNSIVRNVLYHYEVQLKQLRDLYQGIPWMCLYAVQLILFTKQIQLNCFHQNIPLESQQSLLRQAISRAVVKPAQYSNYITLLLHLLHFIEQMRRQNVTSIFNFQWNSFLRFYYQKDNVVMRSMGNQIKWGGQYQGMWALMVNTSDIRRAHVCVLNSIQYANGVLLQGPSGTGKTQSLKQLARCTAKYCVVFNCSQNVNLKTIGKLLSGLCYTASWLCLDQINRLTLEAMSTVAKQIQTIRNAILSQKQVFNFMGKDIKLKQGVAIFSTMNPIYLKRAKLTQNLKSYFRIITVSMPEHQIILQVLLYGLKFYKPRELALKIGSAFNNLSIQLSKNPQYDFGLRAMKFLISSLHRRRQQSKNQIQLVIKAFYDVFYFKLIPNDKPIFEKIMGDVFKSSPQLRESNIKSRANAMKQAIQTGIIVFGPVSIKSTLIKQYYASFTNSQIHLYNPNSSDMRYFLGELIHGRWEEGVVQKVARSSLAQPQKIHLLVLDSTLKSQIIENFNTLLDESKLLTLSNGTRLKIQDNFKIIMQTPHLNLTSPSTITRCHIIYVCDKDVETNNLILSQIPIGLTVNQQAKKIIKIYSKLTNNQIRETGKLCKIMMGDKFDNQKVQWKQNQILGVEKALIMAMRILGFQNKILQFINKQNSFSLKKSPYHHILTYQRYTEGEYLEISRTYEPIIQYNKFTLKTSQQIFMKWLTKKATLKQMQPILWKGSYFTGKSIGIQFCLNSQKFIKVPLNIKMNSSALTKLLIPQILDKKVQQIKQRPDLIIYIQNLHMSNEQMSQQIRYMMEHNMIFSLQARQSVNIQAMAFVAEARHFQNKQFDRVRRHFSQIEMPPADQIQLKNIYYELLNYNLKQTDLEQAIKNTINIQSERFCTFLANIYINKYQNQNQKNKRLGPYYLAKLLQRASHLNSNNCKNVSDFTAFMFESLKIQDTFGIQQSASQNIYLMYHEFYKGKFAKQYDLHLKNSNFIMQGTSSSGDSPKKSKKQAAKTQEKIQKLHSKIYISKYIKQQVEIVWRLLQINSSHYCLAGGDGSGRKIIFKLACKSKKVDYMQISQQINQKQIRKSYFQCMKSALQKDKKEIIILDLKYNAHRQFLEFCQSVAIGASATMLFEPQETDYMFATIADFADEYSKSSKSYEQVCQDYVSLASSRIHLLIACPLQGTKLNIQNEPTLLKKMYFRTLPEFTFESLVESIQEILKNNLKINESTKNSMSTQNIPKLFVKIYKLLNSLSIKNKQNNLHHFNFNQFHIFKMVEHFCQQYGKRLQNIKQNQDILNRSTTKISQISKILQKLKEQIVTIQPEVTTKRNRILQVVPQLEEKKRKTQAIKYAVQTEKKQIQLKNQEIQIIMKQVQQQILQATPSLNDAIQSVQTIKRTQLSQIKNNMNPHPLIKFTMENMVILFGQSQNWQNVRRNLSDVNLLSRIKGCQPTHQAYLRVKKRIQQNSEWTFDAISKISFGARYLYKWIKSIIKYKDIELQIIKKRQYIDKLKISLKNSQQKANLKILQLANKQKDSVDVEKQYSKITKQLNDLQQLMSINKKKLSNAQKIKTNLQQNFMKWETKLKQLKEIKSYMTAFTILLTLQIQIFPCLTTQQLSEVKKQILKYFTQQSIASPKNLPLLSQLISEQNPLYQNLTHEDLKDNKKLILIHHFSQYPIIIDPDNQASLWLGKLHLPRKITYTKRNFYGATKTAEDAMRYGEILIVLIDGNLDIFCKDLLKSLDTQTSSNRQMIQYNKNTFTLNPQFKLLFFCKSKNAKVGLNFTLRHQVINFQITKLSLQNSLIQSALKTQKPNLYEIKYKIQQNLIDVQNKMKSSERTIIQILMNKKNLIQDQSFIQLLNQNKNKAEFLQNNKKQHQTHITQIEKLTKQFTKICGEAAQIFMSLKQMGKLNGKLVWDVQIFSKYFIEACNFSISEILIIDDQQDQTILNQSKFGVFQFQQVRLTQSRPTSAMSNISISLSRLVSQQNQDQELAVSVRTNKDIVQVEQQKQADAIPKTNQNNKNIAKPIFRTRTFQLNQEKKGLVNSERFNKIINFILGFLKKSFSQKERYIWALLLVLKNEKKEDIKYLLNLLSPNNKKRNLKLLIQHNMIPENLKNYFSKFQAAHLEQEAHRIINRIRKGQSQVKYQFSTIQILIIIQAISPEQFLNFALKTIQQKNYNAILDYQELKVIDWLQYSDSQHPILLLMGEDPVQMLSQYLERKKYKNATLVAMGEDQGKGLDQHIQRQSRKQGLFIIHNFHISSNFMSSLVRLIQQFSFKPPNQKFRLILIGSLDSTIPEQIVSACHKFIVEQPSGFKNKMRDLYKKTQTYIDHSIHSQHKLTYSLCLMHSIINQMQKFGNICWSFPPSYLTSDFLSSIFAIKSICYQKEKIQNFECNIDREEIQEKINNQKIDYFGLRYLIGEICYVGKLSDNMDRKKMRIIIEKHFNEGIMKKNYEFWQGSKLSDYPAEVQKCIKDIEEQNPKTYGLSEGTLPSRHLIQNIVIKLSNLYFSDSILKQLPQSLRFSQIKPIDHKLPFINQQIQKYNQNSIYHHHYRFLKQITKQTRVFNLNSFQNPRQFFVAIKLEVAMKNNVPYDNVVLVWTLVGQKEQSYGINNLTLEGGSIKNNMLSVGFEQKQVTLYFSAVLKKKDKDPNKGKCAIPLYLTEQRGQSIDNYGQNTNLLTQVYLDSKQPPQNWIIKGTAFIAS